jgi:hypothetical protein
VLPVCAGAGSLALVWLASWIAPGAKREVALAALVSVAVLCVNVFGFGMPSPSIGGRTNFIWSPLAFSLLAGGLGLWPARRR